MIYTPTFLSTVTLNVELPPLCNHKAFVVIFEQLCMRMHISLEHYVLLACTGIRLGQTITLTWLHLLLHTERGNWPADCCGRHPKLTSELTTELIYLEKRAEHL